jgi:hypothetical protein
VASSNNKARADENTSVLRLSHFAGAFMVWGCGLLVSLVIFILECSLKRKKAQQMDAPAEQGVEYIE